jgi:integrase
MTDGQRAAQVTRDTILKLLSDEENARVATGEAGARLSEGDEYLDLLRLDQGVQRARIKKGNFLPRSAVSDETWHKTLAHLDGRTRRVERRYRSKGVPAHIAARDAKAFSSHSLRHGLCAAAAEAGASIQAIMSVSGHRSVATVEKYCRQAHRDALSPHSMTKWKECVGAVSMRAGRRLTAQIGTDTVVTELIVGRAYSDGATIDREPHPQSDEGLKQARANH